MAYLSIDHALSDSVRRNRAGKLPSTGLRTSGISLQTQQLSAMVEVVIEVLRLFPWVPHSRLVEENPAVR